MTPQEESIKSEMRLSAVEYLLSRLYVAFYEASGLSTAQISEMLDQFVIDAGKQKFPNLDPAMSDLASAEWESAVRRLVDYQKAMLEQARGLKGA